jgi:hypothetical protein
VRLGAIVGPGRSGTTWAGSLIDSCPDVIYRFEPFHRLSKTDAEVAGWMHRLRQLQLSEDDLPRVYEKLRRAHPLTNKEPFFDDKEYPLRTAGRKLLWPIARLMPPAARIYGAMYTPPPGPPLVFKEVTFIKPMQNILERTSIPVVYVVRHPCATVLSSIKVQMRGGIPARIEQLRRTLNEHASHLVEQFEPILEGRDLVSQAALLWRYEVEKCVTLVRCSVRGIIITYEQLAEDAYAQSKVMFDHLGISFGRSTERFIESLHDASTKARSVPRRTGWSSRNFSVYRNPKEQKDSWKKAINLEDRSKIEAIVQGVPALEYCASLGKWW